MPIHVVLTSLPHDEDLCFITLTKSHKLCQDSRQTHVAIYAQGLWYTFRITKLTMVHAYSIKRPLHGAL